MTPSMTQQQLESYLWGAAVILRGLVDAGDYNLALSLAPVTIDQFVAVCEQGLFMPPKSTWFDPKIRSGLVIALLE